MPTFLIVFLRLCYNGGCGIQGSHSIRCRFSEIHRFWSYTISQRTGLRGAQREQIQADFSFFRTVTKFFNIQSKGKKEKLSLNILLSLLKPYLSAGIESMFSIFLFSFARFFSTALFHTDVLFVCVCFYLCSVYEKIPEFYFSHLVKFLNKSVEQSLHDLGQSFVLKS